jgi:hypothetical protein
MNGLPCDHCEITYEDSDYTIYRKMIRGASEPFYELHKNKSLFNLEWTWFDCWSGTEEALKKQIDNYRNFDRTYRGKTV